MDNVSRSAPIKFKKESQLKEIWRRYKKNKLAMVGLFVIVLLLIVCIFADYISPYENAITMNIKERLQGPSLKHIFGTDGYGRDLFARCVHGCRISLLIGFTVSIITMIIGAIFGVLAGYYGEITDNVIMRSMDIFSAIPPILMSLAVISALGQSLINLIFALTISSIPSFVRVVRSSVLGVAGQEYIEAAKAGGVRDVRLFLKHILPNAIGPLIVQTTMSISTMILTAATMSFVGLGVVPPTPEWGSIINEAKEFMRTSSYIMIFPGILIVIASLAASLMGDGLRDALDPRLKS